LLIVLTLVVWKLAQAAPEPQEDTSPFGAGHLTTIFALLAVSLGGIFSAVTALFATRVLGTPVPSGIEFSPPPDNALQIPWPIYAFGAAPIGLLLGLIVSALPVGFGWLKDVKKFSADDGGKSMVREFYGDDFGNADAEGYRGCRTRIARAWAVGQLVRKAAVAGLWAAAGMIATTVSAEIYAALTSPHTFKDNQLHGFASMESVVGLLIGGVLIGLLRSDYSNPSRRKTIGAIWDVGTFWPRATHPLAPPCYAERAVPELVDRIRILTGTVPEDDKDPAWLQIKAHERNADTEPHLSIAPGPVLLTGYSQGAIIAPAVAAQLPHRTRQLTALLTLACPARQLYGRAFPAYFGKESLNALHELLDDKGGSSGCRWKNLVRRTDYIGSWVFKNPDGRNPDSSLVREIDQPCWDPVTITADLDPTPPPIHRHTGFWQDPRVTQLGEHLGQTSFLPGPSQGQPHPSSKTIHAESQPQQTDDP
jgi:hypothetical protein